LAIWLFKGKAIYLDNGLLSQILKLPKYFYSSPDYPLLLPFLFSIIYKLAGGIREIYVLLLYPFFYSAILILVYKTLKGKTTTTVALFFTYLYSMLSPLLAQAGRGLAGNADIVLVFFSWLIIYLVFTRPSKNFIFYISVIAAVSSQIKTEGLFLATPLLFLPNSRCRKISFLSLAVFPFIFWIIMTKIIIVTPFTRFFIPSFAQLLPRIFIIFSGLIKEMLNVKNWYIFWPIFSLCLFRVI